MKISDDDTPASRLTVSDTLTVSGTLTMDDGQNFTLAEWVTYRLTKRPESLEDALAVIQAFWDAGEAGGGDGFIFSVPKEKTGAMDANPMLERTDALAEEET